MPSTVRCAWYCYLCSHFKGSRKEQRLWQNNCFPLRLTPASPDLEHSRATISCNVTTLERSKREDNVPTFVALSE